MQRLAAKEGIVELAKLAKSALNKGQRYLILNCGKYDTNKKELVDYFNKRFPGRVVSFHHTDFLNKAAGKRVCEKPEHTNWNKLTNCVERLLAGETVTKPKYDATKHDLCGQEKVQGEIVIVWGVFALHHQPLNALANQRVYFESEKFTRVVRYFLSELKNMTPTEIVKSLIDGQRTNKNFVEPTKNDADFILRSDSQPSFSGKRARKLVDHLRWPVKLDYDQISACGRVRTGDTKHQLEHFIFCADKSQVIRLREDSIAFKSDVHDLQIETWYEFPIDLGLSQKMAELYQEERVTVSKLRTIYSIEKSSFRFYVDRNVRVTSISVDKEIGDFSGLIRRRDSHVTSHDIEALVACVKLNGQHQAKPYYLLD